MIDNFGFVRVAACSPEVKPADIDFNITHIIEATHRCMADDVNIVVFPELCITGYTCADLFGQSLLVDSVVPALDRIAREFRNREAVIVVGAPIRRDNRLYNCAVVIQNGHIRGIVPKSYIPNYGEFYERRWFHEGQGLSGTVTLRHKAIRQVKDFPFGTDLLFEFQGVKFGIEICEDLWVPIPPSSTLSMAGAEIILNLSASDEVLGKHSYLLELIKNQSARCRCVYAYASAGLGESSTDLAFAGNCIIAENGKVLSESERFTMASKIAIADLDVENLRHDRQHFGTFNDCSDLLSQMRVVKLDSTLGYEIHEPLKFRHIDPHPFIDGNEEAMQERCDEISSIQAWGLAQRLRAIGCCKAVVGISGGLDSTLALLVTVKAFDMLGLDRKGIIGITMPGFGTTDRTHDNASRLMSLLGVTQREIPIAESVNLHFKDIGHNPEVHDVTYENCQARERTQILMDVANQTNGLVIGTGDLSELALGWCTYNGDQMSMYGVNSSIPKTLVKYLVEGYARHSSNPELAAVLRDIIGTPISPELLPQASDDSIQQKTEDLVGPYELHDFFMYHIMRHGTEPRKILLLAKKAFEGIYDMQTIKHWLEVFLKRFFSQQFKRSCMPDGVKVGSISLSPRGDWRMPSDASSNLWKSDLNHD